MTSMHRSAVAAKLRRFLDRRTMPQALVGKQQALEDELSAITAIIARYAPHDQERLVAWWDRFETELGQRSRTRAWPVEGEVYEACQAVSEPAGKHVHEAEETDYLGIAAKQMRAGDPVGEAYFWGASGKQLVQTGQVPFETLRRYRSSLYHAECEVYGKDVALEREAARKAHWDAAPCEASPTIPDKRHVARDGFNA